MLHHTVITAQSFMSQIMAFLITGFVVTLKCNRNIWLNIHTGQKISSSRSAKRSSTHSGHWHQFLGKKYSLVFFSKNFNRGRLCVNVKQLSVQIKHGADIMDSLFHRNLFRGLEHSWFLQFFILFRFPCFAYLSLLMAEAQQLRLFM